MISELNHEEIIKLINDKSEHFICTQIDEDNSVFISKSPLEINKARFRITVYFNKNNVVKTTLVAVDIQNNDMYINCDTDSLHRKWLKESYGDNGEDCSYGIRYTYPNMDISSEHDPRGGSDIIIVSYKKSVKIDSAKINYDDFDKIKK